MNLANKKLIFIILTVIFFSGMLIRNLNRAAPRSYCDVRIYYHAAQAFIAGKDIYLHDSEEIANFKYSPFFAFIVSPLGFLPVRSAAIIFFTLNFLAIIAFLRWAIRLCPDIPRSSRHIFFLYFLTVFLTSRFILVVWDPGQVNIFLCALTAGALYFASRKKDAAAGAMLAGAILIKYMPAIFIPYLLLRRRFKAVLFTICFFAVFLLTPSLFIGIQKNFAYLVSWVPSIIKTSLDQGSYLDSENQSLFSMFLRYLYDPSLQVNFLHFSFQQAIFLSYVIAFALYCIALIPKGKNIPSAIDYAMLFCLMALYNPNAWLVNFVALAVPIMVLLDYLFEVKGGDTFVLICVIISFLFTSATNHEMAGKYLENMAKTYSFITIGALLLMVALIKVKFFNKDSIYPPHAS